MIQLPSEFSTEVIGNQVDRETILRMIEDRVIHLMETDIDLLMSYLYRLDIEEADIHLVLGPLGPEKPSLGLAELILARQQKRIDTKKKYKQFPIEGWEF